jgi:uncharacterized protein (DUF983 family)
MLEPGPIARELEVMERPNNSAAWILSVAARSKCPRCGKGKLFDGFLKLAPRCEVCDLDYSFADTADGPAFFAMMGMAVPVTAFAVWLELAYEPPLWVHAVTTLPVILLLCVLPLRFLKGALVASQYVNKAEEARFGGSRPEGPA